MTMLEIFQMLGANIWLYGGAFVLVLGVLVFVHEWGHYIVARLCGVKVEEFSIGFGYELFGFHDRHGTRWKVSLIPLGGYVKLFGDVDPASAKHTETVEDGQTHNLRPMTEGERKQAFFAKPVWQRAAVVFAGPAINYLFAIILMAGLFIVNGQPVTPPVAAAIVAGSSADKAGFKTHDRVLSIDGRKVTSFEDIRREMLIALDTERHFLVERGGETLDIMAKPARVEQKDRFGFKHSKGLLGLISPRQAIDVSAIKKIGVVSVTGPDHARKILLDKMGQVFQIEMQTGEKTDSYIVSPQSDMNDGLLDPEDPRFNMLIVSRTESNIMLHFTPLEALGRAVGEAGAVTMGTLEALGQIVVGTRSTTELGGVIRIGALAGDMAQQGVIALVLFTALLSINLGLINLFPIPMLDGGHLVFYFFEAILGRPIPDRIQEYAFRFGLAFLVGIMVFANLNDIMQLILQRA